jgi:hypothetical protein
VDRAPHYVLSVVLPGAAHVLHGRHVAGWAMGLGWAAGWNVVILGTWVIPESFPAWAVPAAWSAVTAAWVSAPVTAGMLVGPPAAVAPTASPSTAVPAPTAAAGNS